MSRRVTIPFHVSSQAATDKGGGRFEIPLNPPLEIGHTAHPTVYLNNLSFTNTFANIDKDLYDNADLHLQVYQAASPGATMTLQSAPITLDTGNYSLSELEAKAEERVHRLPEHPCEDRPG